MVEKETLTKAQKRLLKHSSYENRRRYSIFLKIWWLVFAAIFVGGVICLSFYGLTWDSNSPYYHTPDEANQFQSAMLVMGVLLIVGSLVSMTFFAYFSANSFHKTQAAYFQTTDYSNNVEKYSDEKMLKNKKKKYVKLLFKMRFINKVAYHTWKVNKK